MKLQKQFKGNFRDQILLVGLTFILVVFSHHVVVAKTVTSSSPTYQKTYQISQNFLELDFGNNYYSKMLEADRFYKQGNLVKAKQIQQEVKKDFPPAAKPISAVGEAKNLPDKSQQYWLTANESLAKNPKDKDTIREEILEPLKKLVKESPEFVPGHIMLAETYFKLLSKEKDGINVIEKTAELYPGRDDVLDKKIEFLLAEGKYLEASIAAREFAYSYPDYYKSSEYKLAADKYYQQYQEKLKGEIEAKGITGIVSNVVDGDKETALNMGEILLSGEAKTGQSLSESYKSQLTIVSDSQKQQYVNNIGQKLAQLMGRNEFTYEFNLVEDTTPNAFALPGGKIFIHTGILSLMDSEAELAGILGHEIAHSVLSHSYQNLTNSTLIEQGGGLLSDFLGVDDDAMKIGGFFLDKKFSRNKEKQADLLGLRVLNAANYSADGLYNVMAKLKQLEGESNLAKSLLASHPASEERMRYLEELIQNKGYNRYAFEGVEEYRKVFPS
jgi:Zn-dependent protease with chaperone function